MRKGVAVQTETPGSDPESGEMSVHARGYHWAPQSLDVIAAPWLCTMLMVYLLVGKKRSCSRLLEPVGYANECVKGVRLFQSARGPS